MTLLAQYEQQVATFVAVCHRLAENMYVTGHGGNLAWKMEADLLLITPTKMNKGDVQPEDVVFINLKGETVEGQRRPTGETSAMASRSASSTSTELVTVAPLIRASWRRSSAMALRRRADSSAGATGWSAYGQACIAS